MRVSKWVPAMGVLEQVEGGLFTAFAFEGEEVEAVAGLDFAVRADRLHVLFGQLGQTLISGYHSCCGCGCGWMVWWWCAGVGGRVELCRWRTRER